MIIVALDSLPKYVESKHDVASFATALSPIVSGFKVGLPLILRFGVEAIDAIRGATDRLIIADFKLADIGDVTSSVAKILVDKGVDAVIAHFFTGVEDSLDKLIRVCRETGLKLILVLSMSHRGSFEFIDKHFGEALTIAKELGVYGVVVPANKPELIKRTKLELRGVYVFSPGVGYQGAEPGSAICAGADYEIIGRSITLSNNPIAEAFRIHSKILEVVSKCGRSF